jgi:DNA repair protein RadA
MHTSSTVYESLEHIQDITSDTLEKLKKLHIESVSQLAVQSPRELVIESNDNDNSTLFDIDFASKLVANARKLLTEHVVLSKEFSTADDLLAKRNKLRRYTVGLDNFDAFLNGGFETQAITELAGEYGSGKSQICHTLCVAANTLLENDKLGDSTNDGDENKHTAQRAQPSIIFIDTENTFRADRVYQIAEQKNLNPETILTRIYHCRIYNSLELELIINNLGKSIEQYNTRLVIIDSIISLHRAEFSGRETLAERQQRLGKLLNKLRKYADVYNIAIVITNQVISSPQSSQFGLDSLKAAGGNILGHGTTYRIFLKKSGRNRVAVMYDSPCHPYQQVKFAISDSGIQNAISLRNKENNDGSESAW